MGRAEFGRLLREVRLRSLLTLENLVEMSGVSVRAISDMERGQSLPRQATLGELMGALELDEDERRRFVEAAARRGQGATGRVPRQLPPDLAVFRGREEALATVYGLTAQVAEPGGHVVVAVIGGMAGVGKTTLAVYWAHHVADHFPDGQLYVNLRGFEDTGHPMDPAEALGGFLAALGVSDLDIPRGAEERGALFREWTASRRMTVVLDNARDEQQVRPLLPASTGCLTVITSRSQLSSLVAVEGARPVGLDVWTREEALSALAARIGEERYRAEPEAAGALVELCGHLALAVAIVAAQVSVTPGSRYAWSCGNCAEAGRCWTPCRPVPAESTSGPCSRGPTGPCRRRQPCSSGIWPCTRGRRCRRRRPPHSRASACGRPGGCCGS
ncbi:helix-turn-helix transcriptional regulator [Streptomyces sp. NPDC005480]|uniref:helix-turn-helix transcriptional regulator n=1 Tax=Streptomyces sp. NPDC005480 TaxID=3154880 RepID=UPI0033B2F988